MKFVCGKRAEERRHRLENWHDWFAWHPVNVSKHDCRWLETVKRKGRICHGWDHCFWEWSYLAIAKEPQHD